jgi:hypothetical protein
LPRDDDKERQRDRDDDVLIVLHRQLLRAAPRAPELGEPPVARKASARAALSSLNGSVKVLVRPTRT